PTMDTGVIEGGLNVTLTIRLLMHGKVRVPAPCGRPGTEVALASPQSGARINISEGNCPERIITLAGPTNAIFKAFAMIIDKLEEDCDDFCPAPCWREQELRVHLTWCGAELCGPHLSTGAQVQVAGDMLPNSTERAITIAGIPQSIIECVKQICVVMLESPPKGVTIPYRPKPSSSPVIFAGGQVRPLLCSWGAGWVGGATWVCLGTSKDGVLPCRSSPVPGRCQGRAEAEPSSLCVLPSQLIGCIIGRQGAKINEIRQMSGAQIKIANPVEGSTDRQVTITGSAASISLAQYLI
ncbi:PCBP2 protein, partial [Cercotrichas coryphoeus]|nr:PCBP2 protein [Cercotrichas coryphoeus]